MAPRPELERSTGNLCTADSIGHSTPVTSHKGDIKDGTGSPRSVKSDSVTVTVPPDGGWGWAVLFGTMLVNLVTIGHVKSFGVYFPNLMQHFSASPSRVAWIQALQISTCTFLSPVSSIMSQVIGPRNVALVGGILACFGLTVSSFVTKLGYIYFFYGVIQGLAATLSFTPGVMMIGQYFDKRRGFANGLGMAGNALGGILIPLLVDRLIAIYGVNGALLVMGGVILHACVGAMFWQPVEQHMVKVKRVAESVDNDVDSLYIDGEEEDEDSKLDLQENLPFDGKFFGAKRSTSVDDLAIRKLASPRPWDFYSRQVSMPGQTVDDVTENLIYPSISDRYSTLLSSHSADTIPDLQEIRMRKLRTESKASSFLYLSTFHLAPSSGALLTRERIAEDSETTTPCPDIDIQEVIDDKNNNNNCEKKQPVTKKKRRLSMPCFRNIGIDLSILHNSVFYVLMVSIMFHLLGYPGTQMFLPYRATTLGLSQRQAASLLSILAFSDLIGRIGCAWLSDFHWFPRKYWYIGGIFMSGVCAFSMQFTHDYLSLCACSAAFGLASGAYVGLMVALFADAFGGKLVALAYSLANMLSGFVALGGTPLMGYVLEQTGSYSICQTILGLSQVLGAAVWIFEPFAVRREKRKSMEQDNDDSKV